MSDEEKHNPFDKPKQSRNNIFWLTPGEKVEVTTLWDTHKGFTKYGETLFLEVLRNSDGLKMDLIVPKKLSFVLYDIFEEVDGASTQLIIERDDSNNYNAVIVSEES